MRLAAAALLATAPLLMSRAVAGVGAQAYFVSGTERAILVDPAGGLGHGSGIVFDTATGFVVSRFDRLDGTVTAMGSQNYGALVFVGTSDGIVEAWDTESLARRRRFRGLKAAVTCIDVPQFGPHIAAADAEGNAIVWPGDLASARHRVQGVGPAASAIAVDSVGGVLAIGHEGGLVRSHRWTTNNSMYRVADRHATVTALEFASDGSPLAVGRSEGLLLVVGRADGVIEFRQAGDGGLLREQHLHRAAVSGLSASPDRKYIASTSLDGQLILWSVATMAPEAVMGGGPPLLDAQFSLESDRLMATGGDATVRFYSVAGRFETGALEFGGP